MSRYRSTFLRSFRIPVTCGQYEAHVWTKVITFSELLNVNEDVFTSSVCTADVFSPTCHKQFMVVFQGIAKREGRMEGTAERSGTSIAAHTKHGMTR